MIKLLNLHLNYRPIYNARENTTNENTDGTIFTWKSTCNFYDTVCDKS